MDVDEHSNVNCDWCGVNCIRKEVKVKNGYVLCSFCNKFPSIESMELWKSIIVNYALVNRTVELRKIDTIGPNDYFINYYVYEDSGYNIRIGWIA